MPISHWQRIPRERYVFGYEHRISLVKWILIFSFFTNPTCSNNLYGKFIVFLSFDTSAMLDPFRHRTVKHSSLFITAHSLGFNAQSQSTGLGELMLPIQIDNLMTVRTIPASLWMHSYWDSLQSPNTLSINIQQLSCISKQWNIENLSPLSQSRSSSRLPRSKPISLALSMVDSIRYGENLSLLFKCQHRSHSDETVQMKHMVLSTDESMKNQYVTSFLEQPSNIFLFLSLLGGHQSSSHQWFLSSFRFQYRSASSNTPSEDSESTQHSSNFTRSTLAISHI